MTDPEAIGRETLERGKVMLALLAATAALAAGAQALAPSPAAAMINLGNDCTNLSGWALFECEMHGAGAGGGSGGGGGGSNGGDAGTTEIPGEVIRIHDTPPPECMLRPRTCLPSMPGGRHQIGSDGMRPRGPRPGHRPVRVGEVAKGKLTKEECRRLIDGQLKLPSEANVSALAARMDALDAKLKVANPRLWGLKQEELRLRKLLKSLQAKSPNANIQVVVAQERLAAVWEEIESLGVGSDLLYGEWKSVNAELKRAFAQFAAQQESMRKQCAELYPA
jgi:hypothetical protein